MIFWFLLTLLSFIRLRLFIWNYGNNSIDSVIPWRLIPSKTYWINDDSRRATDRQFIDKQLFCIRRIFRLCVMLITQQKKFILQKKRKKNCKTSGWSSMLVNQTFCTFLLTDYFFHNFFCIYDCIFCGILGWKKAYEKYQSLQFKTRCSENESVIFTSLSTKIIHLIFLFLNYRYFV